MLSFLRKIGRWVGERLVEIPDRDRHIFAWFVSFSLMTSIIATLYALGNPFSDTFLAHAMNIGKFVGLNILCLFAATFLLAAIFSFMYVPFPRLFLGGFIYTIILTIAVLYSENTGTMFSIIVGTAYSIICTLIALFFIAKFSRKIKLSIVALILIGSVAFVTLTKPEQPYHRADTPKIAQIDAENPGEKGDFSYTFFTYGSGKDIQRDWFGEHVNEQTPSVDASHFITKWGDEREKFWGFDETELPLNGRAWIPDGDGPFPVILMVHGNHTMEYFSTSGYDYLGEQLASRGFIAISVDEDFINYSNIFGSPNRNYELRAWMMMQHLAQLQEMYFTPGSNFYHKIDFDQVGLMGHSRGGQAVLMTADYLSFFEDFDDEILLESMERVNIKGIVAIAPTERKVNDRRPYIQNTSYLLLHGARDADVYDYSNDRQFYRATFDRGYEGFKATVYIEGANHTQFNADWGRMDLSLPRGIFLSHAETMEKNEQQQLTKMYMSAFFESVFNRNKTYEKLFQNKQYGADWLPETTLVTKYKHASFRSIASFAKNDEISGVEGFTEAEIVTPEHRRGSNRMRDALQLEWNESNATYGVGLSHIDVDTDKKITFTMANIDVDTEHVPEVDVEFEKMDGTTIRVKLADYLPFPPVISTKFTHFGLFDRLFRDERYQPSWEPVFQTFEVPLADVIHNNHDQIEKVILHFTNPKGKIMIEEVGIY